MIFIVAFAYIFVGFYVYKFIRKTLNNAKSVFEKIILITFILVYCVPVFAYFVDSFNIPSKIGYFRGMNSDRWFDFLSTYISTIVGTLLSGIILIIITYKQISVQKEDNKNTKRIENAPMFKYDISNTNISSDIEQFMFNSHEKKIENYNLFLKIENIGLNHARNVCINTTIGKDYRHKLYLDDTQSILKKGESRVLNLIFWFNYDKNNKTNNKIIKFNVSYNDVLNNKYNQEIIFKCYVTDVFGSQYKGYKLSIDSVNVKNEKVI